MLLLRPPVVEGELHQALPLLAEILAKSPEAYRSHNIFWL